MVRLPVYKLTILLTKICMCSIEPEGPGNQNRDLPKEGSGKTAFVVAF